MLCSEKLGISDEHEGIILITHDELRMTNGRKLPCSPAPSLPVPGTPLQGRAGHAVLEIAILPNTARATSHPRRGPRAGGR